MSAYLNAYLSDPIFVTLDTLEFPGQPEPAAAPEHALLWAGLIRGVDTVLALMDRVADLSADALPKRPRENWERLQEHTAGFRYSLDLWQQMIEQDVGAEVRQALRELAHTEPANTDTTADITVEARHLGEVA